MIGRLVAVITQELPSLEEAKTRLDGYSHTQPIKTGGNLERRIEIPSSPFTFGSEEYMTGIVTTRRQVPKDVWELADNQPRITSEPFVEEIRLPFWLSPSQGIVLFSDFQASRKFAIDVMSRALFGNTLGIISVTFDIEGIHDAHLPRTWVLDFKDRMGGYYSGIHYGSSESSDPLYVETLGSERRQTGIYFQVQGRDVAVRIYAGGGFTVYQNWLPTRDLPKFLEISEHLLNFSPQASQRVLGNRF